MGRYLRAPRFLGLLALEAALGLALLGSPWRRAERTRPC
jgi:hypothetical protein